MANPNPDLGDAQVAVERLDVLGRGEEELVHARGPAALRHGADLGLGVVVDAHALRVEEAHVVEGVEGLPPVPRVVRVGDPNPNPNPHPNPNPPNQVERQYVVRHAARHARGGPNFPAEYPPSALLGCVRLRDCLAHDEYAAAHPDGEENGCAGLLMLGLGLGSTLTLPLTLTMATSRLSISSAWPS